ncbi:hypothetical protein BKA93DRAFT_221712 [Sparassis latifolia]
MFSSAVSALSRLHSIGIQGGSATSCAMLSNMRSLPHCGSIEVGHPCGYCQWTSPTGSPCGLTQSSPRRNRLSIQNFGHETHRMAVSAYAEHMRGYGHQRPSMCISGEVPFPCPIRRLNLSYLLMIGISDSIAFPQHASPVVLTCCFIPILCSEYFFDILSARSRS